MTLVYTIRDCIRSGDIFVRESKKYNSFDHYLVESTQSTCDTEALSFFNKLKEDIEIPIEFELNKYIEQDEKSIFSSRVYSYFPKISMPEIIYEVNQWTNVLEDFTDFRQDRLQKQKILVASLLADGHNLGFAKMSIASSIDEPVLRRASEFYLNYENLSRAQKTLVNYHNSLEIVNNWGSGQNSSSDGMRVPINSKTIYADYNSHYGNRGGGIYRHVSDQYTPYYVQILEGRDSNHVLDGLLYHDTSLEIYDHSTDTAGYTEQMFALTYLLGFNFKPRIKGIERQQLYAFESFEMKDIKFKKINEKIILENYSEVVRLVESINSVARLIFFGKQGRLNESTIERQLEKVSCLNILLSCLIIWNSRYLEKVYKEVKDEPWFDMDEFKRVSPLGTRHINFLGRYILENVEISSNDGLRELEI